MVNTFNKLWEEAPKLTHADGTPDTTQAPAVECCVVLRGIPRDLYGVVSKTPEGTLKMLVVSEELDPKTRVKVRDLMCEYFFDVSDVVSVMVKREVAGERRSVFG
jgi:hypothetical protein